MPLASYPIIAEPAIDLGNFLEDIGLCVDDAIAGEPSSIAITPGRIVRWPIIPALYGDSIHPGYDEQTFSPSNRLNRKVTQPLKTFHPPLMIMIEIRIRPASYRLCVNPIS